MIWNLDKFDVGVIRRILHNLYRENISPSLKKIHLQLNPILDGVRAYPILDGGGAKKPPGLTLPFSV